MIPFYIHDILLIILGAMLNYCGIKIDTLNFWLILLIVLGLIISYDLLMSSHEEEEPPK